VRDSTQHNIASCIAPRLRKLSRYWSTAWLILCILDVDLTNVQGAWSIERLRRRAPKCRLLSIPRASNGNGRKKHIAGGHPCSDQAGAPAHAIALLERLWSAPNPSRSLSLPAFSAEFLNSLNQVQSRPPLKPSVFCVAFPAFSPTPSTPRDDQTVSSAPARNFQHQSRAPFPSGSLWVQSPARKGHRTARRLRAALRYWSVHWVAGAFRIVF